MLVASLLTCSQRKAPIPAGDYRISTGQFMVSQKKPLKGTFYLIMWYLSTLDSVEIIASKYLFRHPSCKEIKYFFFIISFSFF